MPFTRATRTSACSVVFAFFALSASGMVGDPDVPLLVLVGLAAMGLLATVAAKRWHVVGGLARHVSSTRPTREI